MLGKEQTAVSVKRKKKSVCVCEEGGGDAGTAPLKKMSNRNTILFFCLFPQNPFSQIVIKYNIYLTDIYLLSLLIVFKTMKCSGNKIDG